MNKIESSKFLGQKDTFTNVLSSFDRISRVKISYDITEDDFLRYVSEQTFNWSKSKKTKIKDIITSISKKFNLLKEDILPEYIYMIITTGKEEGNAAYCRGNAIIIPEQLFKYRDLENLIIHELFHIISKNNQILKDKLYSIIKFVKCAELEFPEELKKYKITNPDQVYNNYYMEVLYNNEKINIIPIIYSIGNYETAKKYDFFEYLKFSLLRVNIFTDKTIPLYIEGKLQIFSVMEIPQYLNNIGLNTEYIIGPDEILADNFVLLINNSNDVKTVDIILSMKKLLLKN